MSNSVDLIRFKDLKNVREASEVVGEWRFWIDGLDNELKVKVLRDEDGKFTGIANYKVIPPEGGPYISIKPQDTVEKAVFDSLHGFLSFWKPGESEVESYKNF